jgi:hypothetical protein
MGLIARSDGKAKASRSEASDLGEGSLDIGLISVSALRLMVLKLMEIEI